MLRQTDWINTACVSASHVLVVTGASGSGETATIRALDARAVPGVQCFYFDAIGIPTAEFTERERRFVSRQ